MRSTVWQPVGYPQTSTFVAIRVDIRDCAEWLEDRVEFLFGEEWGIRVALNVPDTVEFRTIGHLAIPTSRTTS
jgi:hypothetical protein